MVGFNMGLLVRLEPADTHINYPAVVAKEPWPPSHEAVLSMFRSGWSVPSGQMLK